MDMQSVKACKEAVQQFLVRVGELGGVLLRLLGEARAGATAPEQQQRFEKLLHEARITVKVCLVR